MQFVCIFDGAEDLGIQFGKIIEMDIGNAKHQNPSDNVKGSEYFDILSGNFFKVVEKNTFFNVFRRFI